MPAMLLRLLLSAVVAYAAAAATSRSPSYYSALPRDGVPRRYAVTVAARQTTPVVSAANAKGAGASPSTRATYPPAQA